MAENNTGGGRGNTNRGRGRGSRGNGRGRGRGNVDLSGEHYWLNEEYADPFTHLPTAPESLINAIIDHINANVSNFTIPGVGLDGKMMIRTLTFRLAKSCGFGLVGGEPNTDATRTVFGFIMNNLPKESVC